MNGANKPTRETSDRALAAAVKAVRRILDQKKADLQFKQAVRMLKK
jgi:hypothetical protein